MDTLKVKVILGSTRQGRFSDKVGAWFLGEAKKHSDMEVELLDLRDYPMPFYDEPASASSKKEPFKNEAVVRWTAKIAEADAYVIIAPEYNHSMPAVLKNALDYVYQEWNNKPLGFVSYGSVMGARSVEQLRLVAVELQMTPIRNTVHIPVDVLVKAAGWAGPADPSVLSTLDDKAKGLLEQLAWWGNALKVARKK
jgi:NAD(P)H-dependent FMN reductase